VTPDAVSPLAAFRADRARYPRNAWLWERSLWAIAFYRLGQALRLVPRPVRLALYPLYGALAMLMQIVTNIEIPASTSIGPGLRIHHAGPVVVHAGSRIGSHCTMNTGVVIGNKGPHEVPTLGDRVSLGTGAQVIGAVTVGDGAGIGAMTLVIHDVPAGAIAVGVPARVLPSRSS
jgi:serine O-acetyltransferase